MRQSDTGSQRTREEATAVVQVGEDGSGGSGGQRKGGDLMAVLGNKIYRTSGWFSLTGRGGGAEDPWDCEFLHRVE